MGSTGDSYDNALAEALNSLYKAELIDNEARPGYAGPWRDRREVERETAAWVHWYNTRRPHLALGGITPQQAENQHTTTRKEAASTSLHKTRDLTHPLRGIAPVTRRCTRYVALHPLCGAAPVMWRCTRTEGVQCLQIGCSAPNHKNKRGICGRPPTNSHVNPLL